MTTTTSTTVESSSSSSSSRVSPELVMNLKDRLKHGQNVTKILESQLDTAQQNISLLQGQVRLANETILNLKKHFHDTENILSQLLTPEQQAKLSAYESEAKETDVELSQKNNSVDSTTRSPVPSETADSHKSYDEKSKSPYARQLRQVLDVLDEEPRKPRHQDMNKDYVDCQTPQKQRFNDCDCGSSSCSSDHYQRKHDDVCKRNKNNGHIRRNESPKSYIRNESHHQSTRSSNYSQGCTGPCCSNTEPPYKSVEKSPPVNYMNVHSPPQGRSAHDKHSERHHVGNPQHHGGHFNENHGPYVNYVPYGYRVVDGSVPAGMPESLQPLSPSSRRKRPFIPVMPLEEPPHLKYTKVKRIDGSKLTAQKVLQDFTKRRFLPYNPRYDLDLLIVPPPIPAVDLIKTPQSQNAVQQQEFARRENFMEKPRSVNSPRNYSNNGTSNQSPLNKDHIQTDQSYEQPRTPQNNSNNNNNNNDVITANKNPLNNNSSSVYNRESGGPYKNFKQLVAIKEEHEEPPESIKSQREGGLYASENHINQSSTPPSSTYQKTTFYDIPASPSGGNALKPEQALVTVGSGNRNY